MNIDITCNGERECARVAAGYPEAPGAPIVWRGVIRVNGVEVARCADTCATENFAEQAAVALLRRGLGQLIGADRTGDAVAMQF